MPLSLRKKQEKKWQHDTRRILRKQIVEDERKLKEAVDSQRKADAIEAASKMRVALAQQQAKYACLSLTLVFVG